ncbi:hypothetical protein MP228_011558 [Amoeboaphelidium protococcarum]|nr:hypothetical protein MP228_011558 [Amoeboaphelidium protococcarum]
MSTSQMNSQLSQQSRDEPVTHSKYGRKRKQVNLNEQSEDAVDPESVISAENSEYHSQNESLEGESQMDTDGAGSLLKRAEGKAGVLQADKFQSDGNSSTNAHSLFQVICNSNAALQSVVQDQLDQFQTNPDGVVVDLVNLIIQSSGCQLTVSLDQIDAGLDSIPGLLEELQLVASQENIPDVPLESNKKQFSKFRKRLLDYWQKMLKSFAHIFLSDSNLNDTQQSSSLSQLSKSFQNGGEVWAYLRAFIITLSSSSFRPFRHVATVVSVSCVTGILTMLQSCDKELVSLQKRIASQSIPASQVSEMEKKSLLLQGQKENLLEHFKDFFDGVYVHRYRDVNDIIRFESMSMYAKWVKTCPEVFMDAQYLRYLGWSLSDVSTQLRQAAVDDLVELLQNSDLVDGLRKFLERFKSRMIEMALYEEDEKVRSSIVSRLLPKLVQYNIVDEEDYPLLYPLVTFGNVESLSKLEDNFHEASLSSRITAGELMLQIFACSNVGSLEDMQPQDALAKLSQFVLDIVNDSEAMRLDQEKQLLKDNPSLIAILKSDIGLNQDLVLKQSKQRLLVYMDNVLEALIVNILLNKDGSSDVAGVFQDVLREWPGILKSLVSEMSATSELSSAHAVCLRLLLTFWRIQLNPYCRPRHISQSSNVKTVVLKTIKALAPVCNLQLLSLIQHSQDYMNSLIDVVDQCSESSSQDGDGDLWQSVNLNSIYQYLQLVLVGVDKSQEHQSQSNVNFVDAQTIWMEIRKKKQYLDLCHKVMHKFIVATSSPDTIGLFCQLFVASEAESSCQSLLSRQSVFDQEVFQLVKDATSELKLNLTKTLSDHVDELGLKSAALTCDRLSGLCPWNLQLDGDECLELSRIFTALKSVIEGLANNQVVEFNQVNASLNFINGSCESLLAVNNGDDEEADVDEKSDSSVPSSSEEALVILLASFTRLCLTVSFRLLKNSSADSLNQAQKNILIFTSSLASDVLCCLKYRTAMVGQQADRLSKALMEFSVFKNANMNDLLQQLFGSSVNSIGFFEGPNEIVQSVIMTQILPIMLANDSMWMFNVSFNQNGCSVLSQISALIQALLKYDHNGLAVPSPLVSSISKQFCCISVDQLVSLKAVAAQLDGSVFDNLFEQQSIQNDDLANALLGSEVVAKIQRLQSPLSVQVLQRMHISSEIRHIYSAVVPILMCDLTVTVKALLSRPGAIPSFVIKTVADMISLHGVVNQFVDGVVKVVAESFKSATVYSNGYIQPQDYACMIDMIVQAISSSIKCSFGSQYWVKDSSGSVLKVAKSEELWYSSCKLLIQTFRHSVAGLKNKTNSKQLVDREMDSTRQLIFKMHEKVMYELIDQSLESLKYDDEMLESDEVLSILDTYLTSAFKHLYILVGSAGSFGVNMMKAQDAQTLIEMLDSLMNEKHSDIWDKLQSDTAANYLVEQAKYEKTLSNIAGTANTKAAKRKNLRSKVTSALTSHADSNQQLPQSISATPTRKIDFKSEINNPQSSAHSTPSKRSLNDVNDENADIMSQLSFQNSPDMKKTRM